MKAMIFAAGRGERMRPLTDDTPKPLLEAAGKPLIVWQIEALARAGFTDIVINHAWLGARIEAALGGGCRFGVRLAYSVEGEALETAGGIAKALPLLRAEDDDGGRGSLFVAVSGDIFTDYDYRRLHARAATMAQGGTAGMHLVMVANPDFHPGGDFVLRADGLLARDGGARLTFANIGIYDTRLFVDLSVGAKVAMTPLFHASIARGAASGEFHAGVWANIGTPAQLSALDHTLRAQAAVRAADNAIIQP